MGIILFFLLVTLSLTSICGSSEAPTVVSRGLKPVPQYKRLSPLNSRSLHSRGIFSGGLKPRKTANLFYGIGQEDGFPATSVVFTAHQGLPIVLLDDVDFLIQNVECQNSAQDQRLDISFVSAKALGTVLVHWDVGRFMMITMHSGCNPEDERGAWLVSISAVEKTSSSSIRLQAQAIPLQGAGSSFAVSFIQENLESRLDLGRRDIAIGKRDLINASNVTSLSLSKTLDPRVQLFPFPGMTASAGFGDMVDNVEIFCIDCSFNNQFHFGTAFVASVSLDCILNSTDSCITVQTAAVNMTIDEFAQSVKLEMTLEKELLVKNVDFTPLPTAPLVAVEVPGLFSLGLDIGLAFRGDLDITGGINFTVGAKASIPKGAFASYDIASNSAIATGWQVREYWDDASLDLIPFRLNSGQFNVSFQVALSPYLQLGITVGEDVASVRVYVDSPKLSMQAQIVEPSNRNCQKVGPDDFETFSTAFNFQSGLTVGSDAGFALISGDIDRLGDQTKPLFSKDLPFPGDLALTKCVVVVSDGEAATGTLMPAASAVPSFDVGKIESYYSAHNGQLPTGVNYDQMAQVTTVPSDISKAVDKAADQQEKHNAATSIRYRNGLAVFAAAIVFLVNTL
ncbi:hypothetical protein C8J56DRAFT_1055972 [Mycena floridula]|nr:hypothetical protein C8J56DRAFT_1055972 [Mycena floridula]